MFYFHWKSYINELVSWKNIRNENIWRKMFKGVENSTGDWLIAAEKFQFNRKLQDATMKTIFLLEGLTIFWCQVETFHKLAIFRYCNTAHGIPLIQTHRFHQICICEKFNLKNSIIIFNVVCDPDAVPLKWKCWIRLFIRCAQFIQIQIQVEHCEYFMVFFFGLVFENLRALRFPLKL